MHFLSSYYWEKGQRANNQDSIALQEVVTKKGPVLMACVCDGIGGMQQGEVASGYITEQIVEWFYQSFLRESCVTQKENKIRKSGYRLFFSIDRELKKYAEENQISLGSTATLLLIFGKQYGVFHIGDTRIYQLNNEIMQLTEDHTINEQTLTRCVGCGSWQRPDYIKGKVRKGDGFLLCSDGFRHYTTEAVLGQVFAREKMTTEQKVRLCLREVGKRNMERGERDNISAIYVKVV